MRPAAREQSSLYSSYNVDYTTLNTTTHHVTNCSAYPNAKTPLETQWQDLCRCRELPVIIRG